MTQVQTPAGLRWILLKARVTTLPKTQRLCYDVDVTSNYPPTDTDRRLTEILTKHLKAAFLEIGNECCGAANGGLVEGTTPEEIAAVQAFAQAAVRKELGHS